MRLSFYLLLIVFLGSITLPAISETLRVPNDQVSQDIRELEGLFKNQFSFYHLNEKNDALQKLETLAHCDITEDLIPYRIALQEIIAPFGDAHAKVKDIFNTDEQSNSDIYDSAIGDIRVIPGHKPRLVILSQAINTYEESNSYCEQGLLDPEHPFLVAIDDIPTHQWIAQLQPFISSYNQARIFDKAAYHLQYLNEARMLTGRPVSKKAKLTLASADEKKVEVTVSLDRWLRSCQLNAKPSIYPVDIDNDGQLIAAGGHIMYAKLSEMFNIADSDDAPHLLKLVSDFKKVSGKKGLILDMRGNEGGSRTTLIALYPFLSFQKSFPRITNVATYRLQPNEHQPWGAPDSEALLGRFIFRQEHEIWSTAEQQAIEAFKLSHFTPDLSPISARPSAEWYTADHYSAWHYQVMSREQSFFRNFVDMVIASEADAEDISITDNLLSLIEHWDNLLPSYQRPTQIVVLTDAGIFSAADIMLGALKGMDGITLMGSPSSGGSSKAKTHELPSGTRVKLGTMLSFTSQGYLYDSNGIEPDETLLPTPDSFYFKGLEDSIDAQIVHPNDNLLKAAIRFIKTSKTTTRTYEAGPIWDPRDAKKKCPTLCHYQGGKWKKVWWTTIVNEMSVCQCLVPLAIQ